MTLNAAERTAHGTFTANGSTEAVAVKGYVTCSAHYDAGTGTITWQFKGPDGVWRDLYGGADGTTVQAYTGSHMVNFYFGDDVRLRGTVSSASGLTLDYQIFTNVINRN